MDKNIVISIKTIIVFLLMILSLYIVYRLGPIIAILLICTLLVISLEHSVQFIMQKTLLNRPISRSFAVIITYTVFVAVFVIIFTIGLPPVLGQAQKLLVGISQITDTLKLGNNFALSLDNLLPQISNVSGGIIAVTKNVFSNVATLFSILLISIYMSLDWENIKKRFLSIYSGSLKTEISKTIEEIEASIGHWVKGQLLLMVIIGGLSYTGLVALQVDYPLALGLIAGLLEVVPILGPVMSAVLASIIAFSDSPIKGIAVLVLFTVIQQAENNLLVPKVMQKVSGFSPLVILLALLIGSNLFGIVGAILAVPITMIGVIITKHVIRYSS